MYKILQVILASLLLLQLYQLQWVIIHHLMLIMVNYGGRVIREIYLFIIMMVTLHSGLWLTLEEEVIKVNPQVLQDRQVHQVLGTSVADLMRRDTHSCLGSMPLPKAASQLHDKSTQRLFVLDEERRPVGVLTRGDVVRALASHKE